MGFLVVCLLATFIVVCVMWKKRKHMKREKAGLEYKMDKLEAKFRNQCREGCVLLQSPQTFFFIECAYFITYNLKRIGK